MADKDPLAQLKDIHLPLPISWWPLAPGWYVIITLILLLLLYIFFRIYKNHNNAKAKKEALILLTHYQKQYEKEGNVPLTSARISELLRRVALVYYPRAEVASIHGEEWLQFLNKSGKGIDFNRVKEMLLDAPFKSNQPMDLTPLFNTAERWIKQRSVPCSN